MICSIRTSGQLSGHRVSYRRSLQDGYRLDKRATGVVLGDL
jgi:hypothetical protein